MKKYLLIFLWIIFLFSCYKIPEEYKFYDYSKIPEDVRDIYKKVERFLVDSYLGKKDVKIDVLVKISDVSIDKENKKINIDFTKFLSYYPMREDTVRYLYNNIRKALGKKYKDYTLVLSSINEPIEELIPNLYRRYYSVDTSRLFKVNKINKKPVVANISKSMIFEHGLYNKNIAIWHSHGWYYNNEKNRWEWQRPRLFQTVEDVFPMSYVLKYVVPMLEQSGANVFIPRERDFNMNELIVDNDKSSDSLSEVVIKGNWNSDSSGFYLGTPPYYDNYNPFENGSFLEINSDTSGEDYIEYIPYIPESAYYSVYISYKSLDNSVSDVLYEVYHTGGVTKFNVNQKIGGGTWIYIGKFYFKKGKNYNIGRVRLYSKSAEKGVITSDAIRFGGGYGIIARGGRTSRRLKFFEAGRYYLQFAGMPDTLVYHLNDNNDYKDDYMSRGEYVNYLKGAPFGPNKNRSVKGLNIPIDLSIAFHTDAGIKFDSTIGTLTIYSVEDEKGNRFFPDSVSRLACRDLGDLVQTHIVDVIRKKYNPYWKRRALMNALYSEVYRPNVPSIILELLSHQNFDDMKFGKDPEFMFDVSRAIYKAIVDFISVEYQEQLQYQPLPIKDFGLEFAGNNKIKLKWSPQIEENAPVDGYIVYKRIDGMGFDNGIFVKDSFWVFDSLEYNRIYSFKITAVNQGGESFPSEILSVGLRENSEDTVLIVNNFYRLAAPDAYDYSNFKFFRGYGVPYKYDFSYIGEQYDGNIKDEFIINDAPGFGSSFGNYETKIIKGNTFDFPYEHGKIFFELGYSFISTSKADFISSNNNFSIVDIISGLEKTKVKYDAGKGYYNDYSIFDEPLMGKINELCNNGANILLSGAYIASDAIKDSSVSDFIIKKLKYTFQSDNATITGAINSVDEHFGAVDDTLYFKMNPDFNYYGITSCDAIAPVNGSHTIYRYSENNKSAIVAYKGKYKLIIMGFPFENIIGDDNKKKLLKNFMNFFSN